MLDTYDGDALKTLATMIKNLVRYEEWIVFAYYQKHLYEEQMKAIGVKLSPTFVVKEDDGYTDQFWIRYANKQHKIKTS